MSTRQCPALVIGAPASGQGKTTVTAALARLHRSLGRKVRVFKTGPDFLDPMILATASGVPVQQLDLFMAGEAQCHQMLWEAAAEADLILIEGVMGLYDGRPSTADIASTFNIPVLSVINAQSMAQTFAALALGMTAYRPEVPFYGVLANRVSSDSHTGMLRQAIEEMARDDLHWYGALPREAEIELPSRHLGLVQSDEVGDLEQRLDKAAQHLLQTGADKLPPAVSFAEPERSEQHAVFTEQPLAGVRIGVARDRAFSFIYAANLQTLEALGATLSYFSPLSDSQLPEVDSLYLPGGYPELHLDALSQNSPMIAAVRAHFAANKPILAECGGMLWLAQSLQDVEGKRAEFCGILPAHAQMQKRMTALGLQSLTWPAEAAEAQGLNTLELRGHTFHHSKLETEQPVLAIADNPNGRRAREPVYQLGRLTASYIHFYFPSNPALIAAIFKPSLPAC